MGWLNRKPKPIGDDTSAFGVEEHDRGKHTSMREADPYSFQVAHRRLAWMLRISAGTNIVLAASLALTVNGLVELAPLIGQTKLALVRTDSEDNRLYRIEPLNEEVSGFNLVLEDKARRYVRNILSIDRVTHGVRMAEVMRMTDRRFWNEFEETRLKSGAVKKAIAEGTNRSITVESVNRVDTFEGIHKYAVDFIQTDERDGAIVEERKLRAYLNMTTRPQDDVPVEDKYENPLGIVVLDLIVKKRGNL
jgi:type IV secretion system protein VirB8